MESTATEPGESDMDVSEDEEAEGTTEEQLNDGRTDEGTIAAGEATEDAKDERVTGSTTGM